MQQRRLRLGDILDDYCPRERRVTNHAVVAMLEEQVKQTRCTTCDAEHEYKEARVPAPRRRKDAGILGEPVNVSPRPAPDLALPEDDDLEDTLAAGEPFDDAAAVAELAAVDDDASGGADGAGEDAQIEDGPVHRRLIRATLPRPEGQAPEWKEPEFTIRQPGRGGREIDGNRGNGHGGHGQRPGRHRRRGGGGQGQGQGNGMGNRFGAPRGQGQRHGSGQGQQRQNGNRPGGQPGNRGGDNRGNRGGGGGQGGRRRGGR